MQLFRQYIPQNFFCRLHCRSFWIYRRSCKSSHWNQSQNEGCHGNQRYNLFRDLIQYISLPIKFLQSFPAVVRAVDVSTGSCRAKPVCKQALGCPAQLRLAGSGLAARACLYVHDRVSGWAPRKSFVESSFIR